MDELDNLFDDDLDNLFSDSDLDNLFDDELDNLFMSEDSDYSGFRSGAVEFLEGAIGAGDELDATARLLFGDAQSWDQAIGQSRRELAAFREDNPTASTTLKIAGFGAGLFIPGAGMAKIAQTGTKAARAAKAGALGAAEGSVYGFLSGEGEGRVESAALGATLGGVLGGAGGAFLTKGADSVYTPSAPAPEGSIQVPHIAGEEGFVNVGRAREPSRTGYGLDTTTATRVVRDVQEDANIRPEATGQSGIFGSSLLSTKEWIAKNVGERAARLAEDAETMVRADQQLLDEMFDTDFKQAFDLFENNINAKTVSLRMNDVIKKESRATWDDLIGAAKTPEEAKLLRDVEDQVKLLQQMDFVPTTENFFPTKALAQIDQRVANPAQYDNPIQSVKDYARDLSAARALAARFDIDLNKVKVQKNQSRVNAVISAIEKEAKKQGASNAVAANLANGLRTQFVAAHQGGNTLGAVARRLTSTALLANPLNAVLNMAEGVTAPIYQNGIKAWAATIPNAVLSTFSKDLGVKSKDWLSLKELGLDREFMGEIAQAGQKAFTDAADSAAWTKLPKQLVSGIDKFNRFMYGVSGVSTVNRMGQEILANSAIQRGIQLANKGDLATLRKHDGMRGLSESEFQSTVKALQNGDLTNPWVINFAGASLNKWQPVSAASMPKTFHDNPNGRMMYSMLSYMNRQMNSIRLDVGLQMAKVKQEGINSKEGQAALRQAMVNAAKYSALFGVTAGMWDDFRQTLDPTKDKDLEDLFTPEGISKSYINQLASNLSSGVVNVRSEQYGGKPVEPIPAPVSAMFNVGSGVVTTGERLLTGEAEPFVPLARAAQTYVPGISNVDRLSRMLTGERLLTD